MERKQLIEYVESKISGKRLRHTMSTEKAAIMLAKRYSADETKASTAALLHDIAKLLDNDTLLQLAKDYNIPLDEGFIITPKLLHGPVAAKMAQMDLGIDDPIILNAISAHTLGADEMTLMDKIVFMADYIEEGRSFHEVGELRRLCKIDLDEAILVAMNKTIEILLRRDLYIHPQTMKTRNNILIAVKEK